MASMWNCLLAAMLTVGRKTRLLSVGRSSLATRVPMGWGGEVGVGLPGLQGRKAKGRRPAPCTRGSGGSCGLNALKRGRGVRTRVQQHVERVQQLMYHVISTCL